MYLVRFEFVHGSTSGTIRLRFNSLTGGSDYAYVGSEISMLLAPVETQFGDNLSGTILITNSATIAGDAESGQFFLDTTKKDTDSAFINGTVVHNDSTTYNRTSFSGVLLADVTIADFEIFASAGNLTGNIYIYEYALV
jgi:hypothetical protein